MIRALMVVVLAAGCTGDPKPKSGAPSGDPAPSATNPQPTPEPAATTAAPSAPTEPATKQPTSAEPTTAQPTTAEPTTAEPTTAEPTTAEPTTAEPTASPWDDALRQRLATRAFEGAPPVIPHVLDKTTKDCLSCHARGAKVAGKNVPRLSHAEYIACQQCHVSAAGPMQAEPPTLAPPATVSRTERIIAFPGAPPVVPHREFMREACGSCHGADGLEGLRTTHPERRSCQQCHVGYEPGL